MKLREYLKVSNEELQNYVNEGWVDTSFHPTFPLVIFTYSRKTVAEQHWDKVTTKCRGLIANTETDDIVARPFEKFFNYGDPVSATFETDERPLPAREPDYILEKMDGFLCTHYVWEGKNYIASKGSFDSPHAKWATAWLNTRHPAFLVPPGFTAVFEGITPNLRIVVDYKTREELVLLSVINNETGEELTRPALELFAGLHNLSLPLWFKLATLPKIVEHTLDPTVKNVEGYVLVWQYSEPYPKQTPFRLKLKYTDYLRIHRMVCGTSPKRILEALQNGWTPELDTWLDEGTPWFNHFVSKWKRVLENAYAEYDTRSKATIKMVNDKLKFDGALTATSYAAARKAFALEFTKPENEDISGILFALLDGKDPAPVIWKKVKPLVKGANPMIDAAKL